MCCLGCPARKADADSRHNQSKTVFGENVYSSYTVKSWKPDPGLFLHAAQAMGYEPKDCVVVEDSEIGIQAAQRAGMRAFWYTPDRKVEAVEGVVIFKDMSDLPSFFDHEK